MRKIAFALLTLALGLGGCVTTNPYGNFIVSAELDQEKIAINAVQQLMVLYPPAHTKLELQQSATDPFGQALVKLLRSKGYAISEQTLPSAGQPSAPPSTAPGNLPLRYVLDQAGEENLYRLTLMVGNQSITRPFLAQNGTYVPAGAWVRKE